MFLYYKIIYTLASFPFFENAFIHFLQQPFTVLKSDESSELEPEDDFFFFFIFFYFFFSSSIEHPVQWQDKQPYSPIYILLYDAGTIQTHVFGFNDPLSDFVHF